MQTVSLTGQTPAIAALCRRDRHFAKTAAMIGPLTYQYGGDDFAFLASQIMGQMVSNKVAAVFQQRLSTRCGGTVTPQTLAALTDTEIRAVGLSHAKIGYLRSLTQAAASGQLNFTQLRQLNDQEIIQALTAVRGIGVWTAKMYLIFVLNRPDVLPVEDLAFLEGFAWVYHTAVKADVIKKTQKWRPYRSLAARYFYAALDRGLTKKPFHQFK